MTGQRYITCQKKLKIFLKKCWRRTAMGLVRGNDEARSES